MLCGVIINSQIVKMQIEIGTKKLSELTAENIMQIVMIIGAAPSSEFWNEPTLLDFNNTMFSDTITIDYVSYRKSDNKKSCKYTFFFDVKRFSWHYTKDFEIYHKWQRHHSSKLGLPELRYLISQGFDVPLYNNA